MLDDQTWFTTVKAWIDTFDEFAPNVVEGLYIVGSIALGDWQPHVSDIDIIAVTAEPADDEMSGALRAAHAAFVERHPSPNVDGPFVAWGDLTVAPQALARPWTLDGIFHHDAECFELNAVTWFTLVKYGVRVRGPEVGELPIPVDRDERVRFVVDNARSYWAQVLADLRGAIGELGPVGSVPSSVPVWCLLGVCRMLYTATTGDVASKTGAGLWAADVLDARHRDICRRVAALRAQPVESVTVQLLRDTADAMADVLARIAVIPA